MRKKADEEKINNPLNLSIEHWTKINKLRHQGEKMNDVMTHLIKIYEDATGDI